MTTETQNTGAKLNSNQQAILELIKAKALVYLRDRRPDEATDLEKSRTDLRDLTAIPDSHFLHCHPQSNFYGITDPEEYWKLSVKMDEKRLAFRDNQIATVENATRLTPVLEQLKQGSWDCGSAMTLVLESIEPDIDANKFAWRGCWDT